MNVTGFCKSRQNWKVIPYMYICAFVLADKVATRKEAERRQEQLQQMEHSLQGTRPFPENDDKSHQ